MAAPIIMIKVREDPREIARWTISATDLGKLIRGCKIQLWRPVNVIADEQIKLAVIIVIYESSTRAPAIRGAAHAGLRRNITEFALGLVMEQMISADAGDKYIRQTVI